MLKSEDKIQQEIFIFYSNEYCLPSKKNRCLIFSIPNGGTRNKIEAIKLKSTGLLAGASDLIIIHNREHRGTILLFIEVKTPAGVQSKEQKEFAERVEALGYKYCLVRSLDEFKEIIFNI